jgi:multiple sugar transport system substrate-binding protein
MGAAAGAVLLAAPEIASAAPQSRHSAPSTRLQDSSGTITLPDSGATLPTDKVTFRMVKSGPDGRTPFFSELVNAYQAAHSNITLQLDELPNEELAQAVSLGARNGTVHDIFQGIGIPLPTMVEQGWVAALDDIIPNFEQWKAAFPANSFYDGITSFQGKTYTFPYQSGKVEYAVLQYNTEYLEKAGYDPTNIEFTWDEFREAAKKITQQGNGQYYGLLMSTNGIIGSVVNELGRMAGASASRTQIDWKTGEYNYTADGYQATIDLLLGIIDDGSLFPGGLTLGQQNSQAQFAQGGAGMNLGGPWAFAVYRDQFPDFKYGVASQPLPNTGSFVPLTYQPEVFVPLFAYKDSKYPAIAGDILSYVGSQAGQEAFATLTKGYPIPVFDVDAPDVAPAAKTVRDLFDKQMRIGPDPVVRNPDTAKVAAELQPVHPSFDETVEGILTGQIGDSRKALQELQDKMNSELDRAIEAAKQKGANVSREDWVFPNWDPSKDYSQEDYGALTQ